MMKGLTVATKYRTGRNIPLEKTEASSTLPKEKSMYGKMYLLVKTSILR